MLNLKHKREEFKKTESEKYNKEIREYHTAYFEVLKEHLLNKHFQNLLIRTLIGHGSVSFSFVKRYIAVHDSTGRIGYTWSKINDVRVELMCQADKEVKAFLDALKEEKTLITFSNRKIIFSLDGLTYADRKIIEEDSRYLLK